MGRVGDAVPDVLSLSFGRRQLLVERLELALEALRLLDLLGRGGLAEPLLLRAHLVAARARVAPAGIGREQRVEELGRASAGERGAKRVGLGSSGAEVDHARESRKASITCATPSSSTEGQTKSATAEHASVRVRDGDAVAGPLEQLDVVLAVSERDRGLAGEAQSLGDERDAGRLRHLRSGELEEVGERLRDVEPPVESRLHHDLERVHLRRLADGHELRRRLRQPGGEIADDVDGEILEARVRVGRGRLARDVQLVVHVAEHGVPEVGRRLDDLVRLVHRHRHVTEELAADRVRNDRALVADDGLRDAGAERVRPDRAEHPAGRDDDRDARLARGRDRGVRARAQLDVGGDERAVEVARERLDARREVRR